MERELDPGEVGGGRRTPDESRALIVAGARRALQEVGMGDLTVTTIMERTPLARPSFYVHFGDLDELILELLQQNVALFADPSAVWFEDPTPENMRIGLRQIVDVWYENRGWWGELVTAAMAPRRELASSWRTTEVDNWAPMIAALIPKDGPAVRAGASVDSVARFFVLLLFGVLAEKSVEDDLDLDQLAQELYAIGRTLFYGAG